MKLDVKEYATRRTSQRGEIALKIPILSKPRYDRRKHVGK